MKSKERIPFPSLRERRCFEPVGNGKGFHSFITISIKSKKEKIVMNELRDAYVERLRTKMAEWNVKIDKFQEKADQAEGETKIQYQKHIEELRAKYAQAEEKIEALLNSAENAWEGFKAAVESSYEALTEAVQRQFPD